MKHAKPALQEVERLVRQGVLRQALMPEFYNSAMFSQIADLTTLARSANTTEAEHARKIWHAWRHRYAAAILPRIARNYEITNHRDLVVLCNDNVIDTSEFDSMLRHAIERGNGDGLAGALLFYPIPISWQGLWTLIHKLPETPGSRIKIREYVLRRFGQKTGETSEERSDSAMALALALRVRQDLARLYGLAKLWRAGDSAAAVHFESEITALRAAAHTATWRAADTAGESAADTADTATWRAADTATWRAADTAATERAAAHTATWRAADTAATERAAAHTATWRAADTADTESAGN